MPRKKIPEEIEEKIETLHSTIPPYDEPEEIGGVPLLKRVFLQYSALRGHEDAAKLHERAGTRSSDFTLDVYLDDKTVRQLVRKVIENDLGYRVIGVEREGHNDYRVVIEARPYRPAEE